MRALSMGLAGWKTCWRDSKVSDQSDGGFAVEGDGIAKDFVADGVAGAGGLASFAGGVSGFAPVLPEGLDFFLGEGAFIHYEFMLAGIGGGYWVGFIRESSAGANLDLPGGAKISNLNGVCDRSDVPVGRRTLRFGSAGPRLGPRACDMEVQHPAKAERNEYLSETGNTATAARRVCNTRRIGLTTRCRMPSSSERRLDR